MYLIFSVKLGGWVTTQGTYSSEVADAKRFSRTEALEACAIHFREGKHFEWLPVYEKDLDHVRGQAR